MSTIVRKVTIKVTWANSLSTLLMVLENGSAEGKQMVREELAKMAEAADAYNEMVNDLSQLTDKNGELIEVGATVEVTSPTDGQVHVGFVQAIDNDNQIVTVEAGRSDSFDANPKDMEVIN
jgi:hypothetical protein